jgi:GT2 family glycosyltransferase
LPDAGRIDQRVVAIVLTHARPRLASDVVRRLVQDEGLAPSRVVVVVNGEGGLEDAELETQIDMVRLPVNLGPGGGFRAGMLHAREHFPDVPWLYLSEDDVGLFELPSPRVLPLVDAVQAWQEETGRRVGAVFAFGRDLDRRTGITVAHTTSGDSRFETVDVAAWGATVVSSAVVDSGIVPDAEWFFGFEDFDFWLRVADAGFALLVDTQASRPDVESTRDDAFAGARPRDVDEPWRAYYTSRNFLELARRHGRFSWTAWHFVKSVRRLQLAPTAAHRRAIVRGLWDGSRRRLGFNPRFVRQVGEW